MKFTVHEGKFATEADALVEIAARGWVSGVYEVTTKGEDFHWHDFESATFILEGTAAAEFPDGSTLEAGPGAWVETPGRVVHRDVPGLTYRGVFGFSTGPADMTRPINKPPADLG